MTEERNKEILKISSTYYRRVAKKVAFCVISHFPFRGQKRDHEPLPISPNRLSAGRTLSIISARDSLPSGVSATKGNLFGRGLELHGSSHSQTATRHPAPIFSPRRPRRSSYEGNASSTQTVLSKTGLVVSPAH